MKRAFARRMRAAVGSRSAHSAPMSAAPPSDDGNHWTTLASMLNWLQQRDSAVLRPNYTWSVLHAARIAKTLGVPRISAVEFGVAGGNGLVALEGAAEAAERLLGVPVDVYGFDAGGGIPTPRDHRDAPYFITGGDFPMDEKRLRARLHKAEVILGLVEETVPTFVARDPAPVGFISFDLDYYSSTMAAFTLLTARSEAMLPRVMCYFDDVIGYPWGDINGERLAIHEFNATHDNRKIDPIYGLRYFLPPPYSFEPWTEAMYIAHALDHPRYADDEGTALVRRLDLHDRPS